MQGFYRVVVTCYDRNNQKFRAKSVFPSLIAIRVEGNCARPLLACRASYRPLVRQILVSMYRCGLHWSWLGRENYRLASELPMEKLEMPFIAICPEGDVLLLLFIACLDRDGTSTGKL